MSIDNKLKELETFGRFFFDQIIRRIKKGKEIVFPEIGIVEPFSDDEEKFVEILKARKSIFEYKFEEKYGDLEIPGNQQRFDTEHKKEFGEDDKKYDALLRKKIEKDTDGIYINDTNTVKINKKIIEDYQKVLDALTHELFHAIRRQIQPTKDDRDPKYISEFFSQLNIVALHSILKSKKQYKNEYKITETLIEKLRNNNLNTLEEGLFYLKELKSDFENIDGRFHKYIELTMSTLCDRNNYSDKEHYKNRDEWNKNNYELSSLMYNLHDNLIKYTNVLSLMISTVKSSFEARSDTILSLMNHLSPFLPKTKLTNEEREEIRKKLNNTIEKYKEALKEDVWKASMESEGDQDKFYSIGKITISENYSKLRKKWPKVLFYSQEKIEDIYIKEIKEEIRKIKV